MTMKPKLTNKDLILLSSLLDDELDPRTKARVETRLQAEPALSEAFEGLRRTKAMLRRAPARRVPHNFTLPASMARVKPTRAFRVVPGLLWSSATVAIVSILFVAGTLLGTQFLGNRRAASPSRDTVTMQSPIEAPAAAGPTQLPPVVLWGGPQGQAPSGMGGAQGTGIGGGAGGDGSGPSIVYPTQAPEISKLAPQGTQAAESGLAPTPTPETTTQALAANPVTGSGPILGVAPTQQQGEILPETNQQYLPVLASSQADRGTQAPALPLLVWVGIGLFALAAGLFIAAVILRRKAQR